MLFCVFVCCLIWILSGSLLLHFFVCVCVCVFFYMLVFHFVFLFLLIIFVLFSLFYSSGDTVWICVSDSFVFNWWVSFWFLLFIRSLFYFVFFDLFWLLVCVCVCSPVFDSLCLILLLPLSGFQFFFLFIGGFSFVSLF